jgi:hypothetical protein
MPFFIGVEEVDLVGEGEGKDQVLLPVFDCKLEVGLLVF